MRTRALRAASVIAVIATGIPAAAALVGPLGAAFSAPRSHSRHHDGLPSDGPPALYRPEPRLPKAAGWPASDNAFPLTSGTGRMADGGLYWTDFLYDDHGTTTASTGGISVTAGSPSFGTYTYPPGPASENGADIFRAAVLRRAHASYWRVDWNTLANPRVPIAEWTFDRDDDAATGASTWPAGAGAHSPGIDTALVVSGRGAQVVDVLSGKVKATLAVTVDKAAQSFVVRVPSSVLRPHGTWRIRLAGGLADSAGTGFAPAADALPTQTRIYNVTFRRRTQEPIADDFWDDQAQTLALLDGNVSKFSHVVHWSKLRRRVHTAQPRPTGWSDRWYVSDVDPGPGIVTAATTIADGQPNYLGRVQPYAVYVPPSYSPKKPEPVTFLLHSLTQNHNQYAATTPKFTRLACKDRHSICVSPLGRGPDGDYFDDAELDFWQVWHAVAQTYRLDPNHTVLCGYSMGGIGSNQIAMAHPDLFARSVTLAGAVGDVPTLANLRWVPTYLAGGAEDELVPATTEQAEANGLQALGDRYRWLLYPLIDHVAYELADSFDDASHYMGHARRVRHPESFSFRWVPRNAASIFAGKGGGIAWTQLPKLGVGTTGDYWVRRVHARSHHHDGRITAFSGERPDRSVHTHTASNVDVTDGPEPGLATTLRWTRGGRPARQPVIRLHLHNVRSLTVLLRGAGFRHGQRGKLRIRTDGRTRVNLRRSSGHDRVLHLTKGSRPLQFTA